jgi:hypothetical protein
LQHFDCHGLTVHDDEDMLAWRLAGKAGKEVLERREEEAGGRSRREVMGRTDRYE